jgi:hypothetical protein
MKRVCYEDEMLQVRSSIVDIRTAQGLTQHDRTLPARNSGALGNDAPREPHAKLKIRPCRIPRAVSFHGPGFLENECVGLLGVCHNCPRKTTAFATFATLRGATIYPLRDHTDLHEHHNNISRPWPLVNSQSTVHTAQNPSREL